MAKQKFTPIPQLSQRQIANFLAKVDQSGGPRACWPWMGHRNKKEGRGHFGVNGIVFKAPRIAYFLATGEDPGQRGVCHTCDWPPCCNNAHFLLGDQSFNVRDAFQKGHVVMPGSECRVRGESHPKAILTATQVTEIRRLYLAGGTTYADLATRFPADSKTIAFIIKRKTWVHVDDIPAAEFKGRKGSFNGNAILSSAQVLEIRSRYASGETNKAALGREYGVVGTVISYIVARKSWKHI